jgi:hypothetical protein
VYKPLSSSTAMIRSALRTKKPLTCLLFGIHRETLYPDYFFCSNCKFFEDRLSSGTVHGLSKRNSKRNKCTVNHTDFFFPTQLKQANSYDKLARNTASSTQPKVTLLYDIEIDSEPTSISGQQTHMSALMEDFITLQAAFEGCQDMYEPMQKHRKHSWKN